jgi:hypothetical protein
MGVGSRTVLTVVLVFIAGRVLGTPRQEAHSNLDQTLFSEEEPLLHTVVLTPGVLSVLLKTKEAKQGLEFANDSQRHNPAQLFRAAEVHLSRLEEVDLVVLGIPPMRGADNCWFWVVRSARNHPRVVLFAGGNSLDVMNSSTIGYRNIRSIWSSPSDTSQKIYHFDGKSYRLWKEKWTPNRPTAP